VKNPLKTPAAASLGLLLARLPLGIFMVVAGLNCQRLALKLRSWMCSRFCRSIFME
jgi:hypothetical protein